MEINTEYDVLIIGSGAAGLSCANELVKNGTPSQKIAILTENLLGSTSYNTGSDKQTYYRLSLVGDEQESPKKMATALSGKGAMHGDIALVEATCSLPAFYNLVHIGVPFPHNAYGIAFVGYKTDNDPLSRGTSIGPLTSKRMTECLLDQVQEKNIKILDRTYVFDLVIDQNNNYQGIFTLDLSNIDRTNPIKNFEEVSPHIRCYSSKYLVIATGGHADVYQHRVYPESHHGSTGLAIRVGLWMQNLTESQFGIASTKVKWNLSGSYQQVIPQYLSFSEISEENEEIELEQGKEFLKDYFPSFTKLTEATFLKGYQWPFNPERIFNYSFSLIDLAVYIETVIKGNRVFLDFSTNPTGYNGYHSFQHNLDHTAKKYLANSNALQDIPIDRLKALNLKAYQFYKDKGIDLAKSPLEIAICAQHSNGGITGDIWWETSTPHIFAIGEVNGSHGIHRPGGSALNSGQVGALRAAQKINYYLKTDEYKENNQETQNLEFQNRELLWKRQLDGSILIQDSHDNNTITAILSQIQAHIMKIGAFIRPAEKYTQYLEHALGLNQKVRTSVNISTMGDVLSYFRLLNVSFTTACILSAIQDYLEHKGGSRGSAMFYAANDAPGLKKVDTYTKIPFLADISIIPENSDLKKKVQMIRFNPKGDLIDFHYKWKEIRPIPDQSDKLKWFELVWKNFDSGSLFEKHNHNAEKFF